MSTKKLQRLWTDLVTEAVNESLHFSAHVVYLTLLIDKLVKRMNTSKSRQIYFKGSHSEKHKIIKNCIFLHVPLSVRVSVNHQRKQFSLLYKPIKALITFVQSTNNCPTIGQNWLFTVWILFFWYLRNNMYLVTIQLRAGHLFVFESVS